ncbi:MAG: hypothetical protein JWM10_4252 [Myxococcaceae bacterium]|nr:hypothetical protein [Myxococcaceae bacterium]
MSRRKHPPPPAFDPGRDAPKMTAGDWARVVFILVGLVFGPQGALMWLVDGLTPHAFTGWALRLLFTVPMTALLALVLWPPVWLVTRRSQMVPLAAIYALLYTPLLAWQVLGYLDVARDADPGRRVEVRYVREMRPAKGPSYDVITSWDDPTDTVNLRGFGGLEGERRPGATVSLTVHRGWLGLEWVGPNAPR